MEPTRPQLTDRRRSLATLVAWLVLAAASPGARAFDPPAGSTTRTGPSVWSSTAAGRRVLCVSRGVLTSVDGRAGVQVRVPGVGTMALVGLRPFPARGTTLVAQGPWSYHPRFSAGLMWGWVWRRFLWPDVKSFPVTPLGKKEAAAFGGWRETLAGSRRFEGRHVGRVVAPAGVEPLIDVMVEAFRFRDGFTQSLSRLAQGRLMRGVRLARQRGSLRALGRGPRGPATVYRRRGSAGRWRLDVHGTEFPERRCWVFASAGPWVIVFRGVKPTEVRDVAEGVLLQQTAGR